MAGAANPLRSLPRWPRAAQWLLLLGLSLAVSQAWSAAGLPAALLLGPMFAGITLGVVLERQRILSRGFSCVDGQVERRLFVFRRIRGIASL